METVEDIVREMRARKLCMQRAKIEIDGDTHYAKVSLQDLAGRIEAAWKREKEAIKQNSIETGSFVAEARRPLRNCDMFATGEEWNALYEFDAFCDGYHICDNCPIGESGGPFGLCIVSWLLAPNKEESK